MENLEKNMNSNIEHIKKVYFWRSAFFGLIILVAGIAIGGASMSIVASHKGTNRSQASEYNNNSLMPRLVRILELKQQQVEKIKPILDGHMQHLYEIREDARVDIANTLDQMNKEIYPVLGDIQKRVWTNELIRIRRELYPEPARNLQGGRGLRRGAGQAGQGGGGRLGRGGQPLNQRLAGPRRGLEFQTPPAAPNSLADSINTNDVTLGDSEPNEMN